MLKGIVVLGRSTGTNVGKGYHDRLSVKIYSVSLCRGRPCPYIHHSPNSITIMTCLYPSSERSICWLTTGQPHHKLILCEVRWSALRSKFICIRGVSRKLESWKRQEIGIANTTDRFAESRNPRIRNLENVADCCRMLQDAVIVADEVREPWFHHHWDQRPKLVQRRFFGNVFAILTPHAMLQNPIARYMITCYLC